MLALRCRRFLTPVTHPAAHFLPVLYFAKYTKIIQKKLKSPEPSSPPPAPLSPAQLDRIARNKRAALEKLTSAQTPPGFGESWIKALSPEFGKPYFKQVRGQIITALSATLERSDDFLLFQLMQFVCDERKRHTVYPPAEQVFTWTQMCDVRDVSLTALQKHLFVSSKQ